MVYNVRKQTDEELKYLAYGQSYDPDVPEYAKRELERRHKETVGYKAGAVYSKAKELYNANKRKKEAFIKPGGKRRKSKGGRPKRGRDSFGEFYGYKGNVPDVFGLPKRERKKDRFNDMFGGW